MPKYYVEIKECSFKIDAPDEDAARDKALDQVETEVAEMEDEEDDNG